MIRVEKHMSIVICTFFLVSQFPRGNVFPDAPRRFYLHQFQYTPFFAPRKKIVNHSVKPHFLAVLAARDIMNINPSNNPSKMNASIIPSEGIIRTPKTGAEIAEPNRSRP